MKGNTFHERKKHRSEHYHRFVFGWKNHDCPSCSGSGYYDNTGSPPCGFCDGTGKIKRKPEVER